MKELKQTAKENNFVHKIISAEEFEDDIGAGVAGNFIRTENNILVWYTEIQLIEEPNLPKLQIKSITPTSYPVSLLNLPVGFSLNLTTIHFFVARTKGNFLRFPKKDLIVTFIVPNNRYFVS